MKKWDTHSLATMKLNKKQLAELVRKVVNSYVFEAEEKEENPFGATEDEGGEDAAAGEEGGEEEKGKPAKAEEPAGVPVSFNLSAVKKYNDAGFVSDKGVVKSINKDGVVVTVKPDDVDVLVNFNDISENVKRFFKNKK